MIYVECIVGMQGGFFCALSQIGYVATIVQCVSKGHMTVFCSSDAGLFGYSGL